jgi:hypothetical protein
MTPYRPVSRTGGFRVSISRRELRWLARASRGEGKRLARRVRRGELDRSVIEAAAEQFPTDAEPRIALAWLDRWGITSAEGGLAGPCASAQPGSSPSRPGWEISYDRACGRPQCWIDGPHSHPVDGW